MLFQLITASWDGLKEQLLEPFLSLDDVYSFLSFSAGKRDLYFKGLEGLRVEEPDLLVILNFIRLQSLRIEEAFPGGSLPILDSGSLSLTRDQIMILLSHMLLLTLKPTKRHIYWVTFENWLTDGRPCAQAYLRGLFSYFSTCEKRHESGNFNEWRKEIVSFERRAQSPILHLPDIQVIKPIVHLSGSIGEYSRNVVDFANENIGFGIGGTQEEILFGSFIELCPAMIFCCDAMNADEAIIIRNVIKYAEYSGYGFNLEYKKSIPSSHSYTVLAIDALDFSADFHQALQLQLEPSNLQRELVKLLAGFSAIDHEAIDTGHWGCGAFGGNKCIKATLQLIAATLTNNTLSFCCFGDEEFYKSFTLFIYALTKSKTTISELWDRLHNNNIGIDYTTTRDLSFDQLV